MKKPNKKKQLKLETLMKAAHDCGVKITVGLEPNQGPLRFPDDPEPVRLLIEESERVSALGNKWRQAKIPNPVIVDWCYQNGWAYALAAAWMRAKLKGEFNKFAVGDVVSLNEDGKKSFSNLKKRVTSGTVIKWGEHEVEVMWKGRNSPLPSMIQTKYLKHGE